MSGAPQPRPQPRPPATPRLIARDRSRDRRPPTAAALARRRVLVAWSKRLLPLLALALLSSIALWPEITHRTEEARLALRRLGHGVSGKGQLTGAHYQSVDEKGRPYTVTAATATQAAPGRIDLIAPQGDVSLQNGSWLLLQAQKGVYMQHSGQLDLAGDVTLYRDDGTTMRAPTAAVDLRGGAATSADPVSAEGPFGTLDATGFTLLDKGSVIQFGGPARLVLNERPR